MISGQLTGYTAWHDSCLVMFLLKGIDQMKLIRFTLILSIFLFFSLDSISYAADSAGEIPSPSDKRAFFRNWAENNPELSREFAEVMNHHPEWRDDAWNDEEKVKYILDNSEQYPEFSKAIANYSDRNPKSTIAAWNHEARTRKTVNRMKENPKAGSKAAQYGADHKTVRKAGWTNPQKSEKIMDYSDDHGTSAKRYSRKAHQNKDTASKAWKNPDIAKKRGKEKKNQRNSNRAKAGKKNRTDNAGK